MSKNIRIPILWRYLLKEFFAYFSLALFTFISIIIVLKIYDIARFASLGVHIGEIALFSLIQIPYILPFAIPLSSLFAAILLFHKLSSSHEVTAFRAFGLSIKEVISPLFITGIFLFLINLFVTFELSPLCRLKSKEMVDKTTSFNPLLLFQKNKLMKLDHSYVEMSSVDPGKKAKDVLFFCKNPKTSRIYCISIPKLINKKEYLTGKNLSFISTFPNQGFDHLYIENQKRVKVPSIKLSHLLRKSSLAVNHEYLPTKMLLVKTLLEKKVKHKSLTRAKFELIRRFSYSFMALSFTLLGISYGIHIGRSPSIKKILFAFGLSCMTLIFFMIGRSFYRAPLIALLFYSFPHIIICFLSLRVQKQVNLGIEI